MKRKYSTLILYFLFFIYLELVSKVLMFNKLPTLKFLIVVLFSLTISLIFYLFSNLFEAKKQRILVMVFLIIISIFYIFNYLYFSLLSVPFSISTLELASQAMDFYQIGFHLFCTKIIDVLLLMVPFIGYLIYQKSFDYSKKSKKYNFSVGFLFIISHLGSLMVLNFDKNHLYSAYNLYYNTDSLTTSNNVLGIFTTQRLSLKRNIFGFEEKVLLADNSLEEEKEVKYNKMEIDFARLINLESDENVKDVYHFLQDREATKQNEYTGIYKGKNLIFILAEGFNSIAVDKELTPTLYKLVNNGFNFTNYYSPVFFSTTGGEFQAMTSLIPTQEILGMWRNDKPYLPYTLGNVFGNKGYNTSSYHNWQYKYYGRDKTMPILGFNNFLACGNGLEERLNCEWLPSDIDLFTSTFNDYAGNEPFATYYITVSGHAPYVFTEGNKIALKNQELVKNLPYSESVKAYLATRIELDNALKILINLLKKKGILDDTVIALVGDHYPYTLNIKEINEVSSYERDELMEVNHSNLIIWNNKNEGKVIDKVAGQLDVLPTLLNLFGIEYDSRLLLGSDIFSDTDGFVIFSDRSWLTNKGRFLINSGFVSKTQDDIDKSYVELMNKKVLNYFTVSKMIMENDLYRNILNN